MASNGTCTCWESSADAGGPCGWCGTFNPAEALALSAMTPAAPAGLADRITAALDLAEGLADIAARPDTPEAARVFLRNTAARLADDAEARLLRA